MESTASSGPDVAFVVFAEALSKHPCPQIWSFLYYLMIFCFGLNQAMITTDTLIDYLRNRFTRDYFLFTVFITIFTLGAFYIMGFRSIYGMGYPRG
jgi:SNF family Na+-dependent transporter